MPFTFNPILTCHSRARSAQRAGLQRPPLLESARAHVLGRDFYRELISEFRNETRFIVAGLINEYYLEALQSEFNLITDGGLCPWKCVELFDENFFNFPPLAFI